MEFLIQFLMFVTALFLIVLILLQRGRGGGLAGALGGMGGQSAFGSKAGDMFTQITSGVAIFWILLCIGSLKYMSSHVIRFDTTAGAAATTDQASPLQPETGGDGGDGKADDTGAAEDSSGKKKEANKPSKKPAKLKGPMAKPADESAEKND